MLFFRVYCENGKLMFCANTTERAKVFVYTDEAISEGNLQTEINKKNTFRGNDHQLLIFAIGTFGRNLYFHIDPI